MPSSTLTRSQANQILDVVIEAGLFDGDKPTNEKDLIAEAQEVVKSANVADRSKVKNPVITKVLDLSSTLQNIPDFDSLEDIIPPSPEASLATETDNVSRDDTAANSTHSKQLQPDGEKESSHYLDKDVKVLIPDLPRDFSKVGDLELRSLHAVRHGILSKVIFELGLEESDYQSAQVSYEQEYKRCQSGFDGKVTDKREQAFLTPTVIDWREKVDLHHRQVTVLRSMKEILENEIKGLSREFTMRTGERTATP